MNDSGTSNLSSICEHGGLARSCEICERDTYIDELQQEAGRLRATLQGVRRNLLADGVHRPTSLQIAQARAFVDMALRGESEIPPLHVVGECICPACGIRHGNAIADGGF